MVVCKAQADQLEGGGGGKLELAGGGADLGAGPGEAPDGTDGGEDRALPGTERADLGGLRVVEEVVEQMPAEGLDGLVVDLYSRLGGGVGGEDGREGEAKEGEG